nr:LptF/LptG family permease [Muricauda myxillae]
MKILDRYILYRFLYNFFSSFCILIVIFIFQGIWLFIDDLAGKGLGIVIIAKFIFYFIPTLVDKVLPLTVLLSSILTFGTFAENYEFAAMKASGISLQRGMRSLIVFVLFLGVVTFFFANNIIPKSEQKMFNLRRNIAKVKPAAAITEGVFSDFEGTGEGMNIKVERKYGEQDRFLDNVIIHKKTKQAINNTVIKAKSGELISSEDSDIIQLVLKDGNYYEELKPKNSKEKRKHPFAKAQFETYTINIDISELNNQDLEEDGNITTDKMKNVFRLVKDIDSLGKNNLEKVEAFSKNIITRMGAFPTPKVEDSIKTTREITESRKGITDKKKAQYDSISTLKEFINTLEQWQQMQVLSSARTSTKGILTTVIGKKEELQKRFKFYNSHILSLHKKYALAFSCIILFFVGAPLGAIIRKGGLGLPMVIAIMLFLAYYFIGVFAGNYSKEGNVHPALGAWLSTLIMLPLGILLTKRATADRGLMGDGNLLSRIGALFRKAQKSDKAEDPKSIKLDDLREFNLEESTSTLTEDELGLLVDSLEFIKNHKNNLNNSNIAEFMSIHRRNVDSLSQISKEDESGIIFNQITNYPILEASELDEYLNKGNKHWTNNRTSFIDLIIMIWEFLKRERKSEDDVAFKLQQIAETNNHLILILKNSNS